MTKVAENQAYRKLNIIRHDQTDPQGVGVDRAVHRVPPLGRVTVHGADISV